MEAPNPDIKRTPLPRPRRVDAQAINNGKRELQGLREHLVAEHGSTTDLGWLALIDNLSLQNPHIANLAHELTQDISAENDRTHAVEAMFVLYWSMRAALDPSGKVELSEFDIAMRSAQLPPISSDRES